MALSRLLPLISKVKEKVTESVGIIINNLTTGLISTPETMCILKRPQKMGVSNKSGVERQPTS
jgi:hypothetical protein